MPTFHSVIQSLLLCLCLSVLSSCAGIKTEKHEQQSASKPQAKELFALWARFDSPAIGEAQPIGAYTAGCLKGAQPLPSGDKSYQVMRMSRKRNFGHPMLLDYLQTLADKMKEQKLGYLLIGDLGMARGGPMLTGHASHQMGLDADLWYFFPQKRLTKRHQENLSSVIVIDRVKKRLRRKYWTKKQDQVLELAAKDPRVDRIFVNPVIKKHLCAKAETKAEWIYKIRAWWGHDEHFHVRLKCPAGARSCIAQEPLTPENNGCSEMELAWWNSDEAKEEFGKRQQALDPQGRIFPELPKECESLTF